MDAGTGDSLRECPQAGQGGNKPTDWKEEKKEMRQDKLTPTDILRSDPMAQDILRGYGRLNYAQREQLKTFVSFLLWLGDKDG